MCIRDRQKAYIGIQKLQQSYVTDNINEELSAALTKLTETEYQVKTAKETMNLANENPVSYTHLDVYKRQPQRIRSAVLCPLQPIPIPSTAFFKLLHRCV